jgi:hypothetical protein
LSASAEARRSSNASFSTDLLLELELLASLHRLELGLVAGELGVRLGNLMRQLRLQHRLFAHGVELGGLDLLVALQLGRLASAFPPEASAPRVLGGCGWHLAALRVFQRLRVDHEVRRAAEEESFTTPAIDL